MSDTDEGRSSGGLSRRTLIRLLVGLGIGIPVLIEGVTFFGLLEHRLFGGADDAPDGEATATERRVGVGDELLPETAPSDRVGSAVIRPADGTWTFVLTVTVENSTESGYELRLGAVTTDDGTRVDGGGTTGRIPPAESGAVTGRWDLPAGSRPETVEVVAVSYLEGSTRVRTDRVAIERIPVD